MVHVGWKAFGWKTFRRSSRAVPALALALLLATTACSQDDKTGSERPKPTRHTTSTRPTSGSTTTTTCVLTGGTTEPRQVEASVAMLLTGLRVAKHGCSDRVVYEMRLQERESGQLGYSLRYESAPFAEDGSGEVVNVKGEAHLVVQITGSGVDLSKENAPQTYTGPTTIDPVGLAHIRQLRRIGDFEGVITWVIGMDSKRPYTVKVLHGPTRLVIDIG